jgi:hypothetical protein
LSYGLTAWGLSQGSLVGLNLAAFAPEAQHLIDTGYFEVQSWPTVLQVPFTSTSLYPDFTLVGPNFSHPFLGTLIAAPFIYLFGFNVFTIRLPFILFSVGTAILIFVIAARKGHVLAGLVGSSFFSFVPYITHYGAGAYLDNILAFFFMLSVYFVLEYSETDEILKRNRYAYLAGIFAAVCALIKIQGAVVSLFVLIAIYLSGCEKKLLIRSTLLYVSIVLIFPITGLLISSEAFVLSLQCMLSISSSYNSVQIPSELSGVFSFFDLIRYWSVTITLLCIVYLLADNTREKKLLVLGAVSWILYGLLFSYKEWYLLSFFAIAAVIFGYVFSNVVTCQKRLSTIVLVSFLSIPNLEKAGASLLQTIGFTTPLVLTTFLAIYLERRGSNWSKQMRKLLYCLAIFYIIASFILMISTTWNYKYWA